MFEWRNGFYYLFYSENTQQKTNLILFKTLELKKNVKIK
jgi:hypothetical protein